MKKALVIIVASLIVYAIAYKVVGGNAYISAPIEEALKVLAGLIVSKLFKSNKRETIRTIAAVAVVFTVAENVSYGMFVSSQSLALRFLFTSVLHVAASAMGGFGIAGFAGAIASHFLYNMGVVNIGVAAAPLAYIAAFISWKLYSKIA